MTTKICKKCFKEKNIDNYRKSGKYYRSECKECEKIYNRTHRSEYQKKYSKMYRERNQEKIKEYMKKYRKEHKENIKEKNKLYKIKHKNEISEYMKKYRKDNKSKINEKKKMYEKEHYKIKENKLKVNIRNLLSKCFLKKGYKKNTKSEKILGCNYAMFTEHLLNTFKKNYGYEWDGIEKVHIDHIIPLATAKTEEEIIKLCNYKNLQLLKAKDNIIKKDKLNWSLAGE